MHVRRALWLLVNWTAVLWSAGAVPFYASPVVAADASGGAQAGVEELDRLWSERADPAAIGRAVALGREQFAQYPSSYELAWRLARAYWRQGDLATDKAERRASYDAARRLGETAVKLEPERVEGHCYYALATGDYGGTLGTVGAATSGIRSTFEREITRAYAIDRDFNHGSPMLALGRYYFALPWPLRDLKQSQRYLEELKQRHPNVLLGRVYLADTEHALGDSAGARQELEYVLSHDPVRERAVEEADVKADAQQRLREWFGATAAPPS